MSCSNPASDLAFDISLYTTHDLILAAEESKRVCKEMKRREKIRLNEIANRLFESDDEQEQDYQQQVHRPIYKTAAAAGYGMKNTSTSSQFSMERDKSEQYISSSDSANQQQQAGGQVAVSGSISNSSSSEKPTLTSKPSFAKYPKPEKKIYRKEKLFEKRLDELRQFKEEHGHCTVPYTDKNKSLAGWCSHLRHSYGMVEMGLTGRIKITKERIEALSEIGFDFSGIMQKKKEKEESKSSFAKYPKPEKRMYPGKAKAFEKRLDELRQFKEEHGHCTVPYTDKNKSLWRWCLKLRHSYGIAERGLTGDIMITKERIEALEEIGYDFSGLKTQQKTEKEVLITQKKKKKEKE